MSVVSYQMTIADSDFHPRDPDGAVVGAGAVVRGEVPPGATAAGNPAQVVG